MEKYEQLFFQHSNEKLDLNNDNLMLIYFYLYNKISSLMNNLVNKIDIEKIKSKNDIEEIRNFVTKIIDITKKQVINFKNNNIKKLFHLPIFKNLFNRFYYVRMYTYYLEGRYKDCLTDYKEYDEINKIEYESETQKSKEYMNKLIADCYFKLKDYKLAEETYDKIKLKKGPAAYIIILESGFTLYIEPISVSRRSASFFFSAFFIS